ncbi:hypothetical protein QUA24_19490 [Microcoleus sp. Pol12B5]
MGDNISLLGNGEWEMGLFRGNHGGIAPTENQAFVGAVLRMPAPTHR